MLRRAQQVRTQIYQLKDATLFMLALWLGHILRSYIDLPERPLEPFDQFAWLYLIIFPGVPLILEAQGFYKRPLFCSRFTTAWLLFKGSVLITMGVILVMFLFKMNLARLVIIFFGAIGFALVWASEELLRLVYLSKFAQSQMNRRLLLIGAPQDTARLKAEFAKRSNEGVEIAGELDLNATTIDDLVAMLHEQAPNGVILNAKHTFFGQVEKAIQACEREGVEAWLIADFFQTQISRTSFDDFFGRPVLVFRSVPEASMQIFAKQLMDLLGSFFLLVLTSPLLLTAAALIKLTSPGPIFFRQERCGLNGKPFIMLKFRSMVTDAEQRQHELAALNEMGGPVFKLTNDPRVTPMGRFLRRYSLDELPQLINVLRGEMSLVGPRPLPVHEVKRFDDPAHRRRLSVRPGLTCLWQVSGRNNVRDFGEWVRLDLQYIDNWSLWLDCKILAQTVPVVIMGTGAK
jgi:exopolysaccharide biosynthesis polyprenyl glycosylphosphotransferase